MAAATCFALTSCLDGDDSLFNDDWKDPSLSEAPFGNNTITEDGIITIAELKAHPTYKAVFTQQHSNILITDDIKLRVRVTGNDIGGNLYKQFAVQDETGAMIIAVNQGGLCGYLGEGQELIIDLKGLYVGNYGYQPEIGAPYQTTRIGRMSKDIWNQHFKLIGQPTTVEPVDFKDVEDDIATNCGKLVTLKGVTFTNADGKNTLINGTLSGSNYYHQTIDGYTSNKLVVRTSSYADFAASVLPFDTETGKKKTCNITGVASRYGNTWQILIRKTSDLEVIN